MIFVSFLLFLSTTLLVDAAIEIRYLFNNGQPLTGCYCNRTDVDLLNNVMANYNYRKLRQNKVKTEDRIFDFDKDVAQNHRARQLPYYPPYCKNNCRGYATGTCIAANCKGFRRRGLYESNEENAAERNLQMTSACDAGKLAINNALDSLVNGRKLSMPCITLVSAPRSIECYDDVVYGEIVSFRAWKGYAHNTKLQENVADGYQVCQSQNVNFEAVGNDCVYNVSFELTAATGGTKNTIGDSTRPFSFMANYDTFWFGMSLLPGNYTLKAYPNKFTGKTKQITFTVLNC